MDDEWVRLYLRLGRHGSQTGVGLPLLQCWVPLSVCFSSVVAWMGLSLGWNKEACPISFHIPCSSWYHHHTVQFFRLQKLNRKIETTYYRRPRWSSDWIVRFWTPADPFRWTKTSVKYSYKNDMTTIYRSRTDARNASILQGVITRKIEPWKKVDKSCL